MALSIEEYKAKNPAYKDTPNGKLAFGLWNKHYKEKGVPMGQYADAVGLSNEDFKGMVEFSKQSGYEPTGRTFAEDYVPPMSQLRAGFQGQTFATGDEIVGGLTAGAQKLMGSDKSFSDLYESAVQNERDMLAQYRKAAPVESAATEIAGSFLTPFPMAGGGASTLKTGGMAAGSGFLYGVGSGEGDIRKRLESGIENGVVSGLFGMGTQKILNTTGKAFNRLNASVVAANKRPTVDSLKRAKNEAYKLVDQDGTLFGVDSMDELYQRASKAVAKYDFDPDADKQVLAVAKALKNKQGTAMTLSELDKWRSDVLWKRYEAASGAEKPMIREIISVVDDVIDNKLAGGSTVLKDARIANGRFKKAELLEEAFQKADLETASAGSGGNITNKYRQAVKNIMLNPKKAKWFTDEELSVMDAFVRGSTSDNILRLVGKLSPSGNGLMLALNVIGATIDPTTLAATAVGGASKLASDARTKAGAGKIIGTVGGAIEKPLTDLSGYAPQMGVYTDFLNRDEERK